MSSSNNDREAHTHTALVIYLTHTHKTPHSVHVGMLLIIYLIITTHSSLKTIELKKKGTETRFERGGEKVHSTEKKQPNFVFFFLFFFFSFFCLQGSGGGRDKIACFRFCLFRFVSNVPASPSPFTF